EPVPRGRVNQPDVRVTFVSPHSGARVVRGTDEGKGPAVRREGQPACAASVWAKRTQLLPRCHIPETGRPVVAGRDEGLAVGREGTGASRVRPLAMPPPSPRGKSPPHPPNLPARLDIPDTRRAIFARRSQGLPVGGESDRVDRRSVPQAGRADAGDSPL